MENKIKNSCNGKRGCRLYILPADIRIEPIYSKVLPKRYDIKKIISLYDILSYKMVA